MIVWLASIPRSGNTFFRILVKSLYHLPTYTSGSKSGDAMQIDKNNSEVTGNRELPIKLPLMFEKIDMDKVKSDLDRLDKEDRIYFIKTHQSNSRLIGDDYRAVVLVRDPRDTIISTAWYCTNIAYSWRRFKYFVKKYRTAFYHPSFISAFVFNFLLSSGISIFNRIGLEKTVCRIFFKLLVMGKIFNWEEYYSSWLKRTKSNTVFVRYEDLIENPVAIMINTFTELGINAGIEDEDYPSFDALQKIHPKFFREGKSNTWKDRFSKRDIEKVWERCGNTMEIFGYPKT